MTGSPAERRRGLATVELCTFETGGGPPAILLHGITGNGRVWDRVALGLAHRLRCVAVDQRGHGRSAKPAGNAYRAADFVADVIALIEDLDAGPAVIVGHSLGARNALVAAAARPELIAAVIALEFVPDIEEDIFDALDARVVAGDRAFESFAAVEAYLRDRYPLMPDDAVERRARHGYASNGDGALRPLADGGAMAATSTGLREDLTGALDAVAVPTLLVRGALSRFVTAPTFAKACARRPDLPAEIVPDADHYVPEVRPEHTVRLVEVFIDGL